jgi:hypothetical protein
VGAALALVLAIGALASSAVWDADLFWHAATGRWIAANGKLPGEDPFHVYAGPYDLRAQVLLRGYWLAQMILAWALGTFGPSGVVVLRGAILVGAGAAAVRASWTAGPAGALLAVVGALSLRHFTGDRPQLFSFLFSAVVAALFTTYRRSSRSALLWALVPLGVLWANVHPASALGAVLMVGLALGLLAERAIGAAGREVGRAVSALLAGAVATLAGPTGWLNARVAFTLEGSELQRRTSEYLSPWQITKTLGVAMPEVWLLILMTAVGLVGLVRKRLLAELVVSALLLFLSLKAFRYVPFLALHGAPLVAAGLASVWPVVVSARTASWARTSLFAAGAAGAIWFTIASPRVGWGSLAPGRFPEEAVPLLKGLPPGRFFCHYDWGGYLLWAAPEKARPWIDGRLLDVSRLSLYTNILWATPSGLAAFEGLGFDYVLLPVANRFTGEVYPLPGILLRSTRWVALPAGGRVILLRRRS